MNKITISEENKGKRIDKFLAKEFFLYSRGEIIRRIKDGKVLVGDKIVKPSYVLESGDEIFLEGFSDGPEELKENKDIKLEVIFENKNIIVINKPAGIQVHPSSDDKLGTLANALIAQYPEIKEVHDESVDGMFRPGIVHRLDKETSGVMVIARNMKAFLELKEIFKSREAVKIYKTIAHGIFTEKEGVIDKPVARATRYSKQVIARKNTKTKIREAVTEYKVIKEWGNYSLLEVAPKTGRMHQIRVHLASLGHPVVGDKVYFEKSPEIDSKIAERQLLHAENLKFKLLGKNYDFSADLPADFQDFMNKTGGSPEA